MNVHVFVSSVLPGINSKVLEVDKLQTLCINKNKDFLYYSAASGAFPSLYGEVMFGDRVGNS